MQADEAQAMRVAISSLARQTAGLAENIEALLVILRGEGLVGVASAEILEALDETLLRCRESARSVLHAFPPDYPDALVDDDVVI